DRRHPFVVRNFRVWDAHWALHPVAPSLLVDGLDVFNADYGVWRPVYKDHAYRDVRMKDVHPDLRYAFVTPGAPPNAADEYPGTLSPVDDLPPSTVITHVRQLPGGKVLVRGATSDNGTVKSVSVNGRAAASLRSDFAEWEITLTEVRPGELKLSARGEDKAGNVEPRPHVATIVVR